MTPDPDDGMLVKGGEVVGRNGASDNVSCLYAPSSEASCGEDLLLEDETEGSQETVRTRSVR